MERDGIANDLEARRIKEETVWRQLSWRVHLDYADRRMGMPETRFTHNATGQRPSRLSSTPRRDPYSIVKGGRPDGGK